MSPSFPSWISRQHLVIALCVAVWGPPRENPGPRPNNRCLVPVSCAVLSAPWVMVCAVWGPPRENPGHRPNNRYTCAVPFIPRLISWRLLWLDASLRVPGAMPR